METQKYAWLGQSAGSEVEDENVARYLRWRAEQRTAQPYRLPLSGLLASALLALAVSALVVAAVQWLGGRL